MSQYKVGHTVIAIMGLPCIYRKNQLNDYIDTIWMSVDNEKFIIGSVLTIKNSHLHVQWNSHSSHWYMKDSFFPVTPFLKLVCDI